MAEVKRLAFALDTEEFKSWVLIDPLEVRRIESVADPMVSILHLREETILSGTSFRVCASPSEVMEALMASRATAVLSDMRRRLLDRFREKFGRPAGPGDYIECCYEEMLAL